MNDENSAAIRSKFLGGSDAAAVVGASRWKTPLRVYYEKRGEIVPLSEVDPARDLAMRRGKRMEPVIVDTLVDEYQIKIVKRSEPGRPNRYVDGELPFLAAEIDFEWEVTQEDADRWSIEPELIGTIQNGEAKSVHQFASGQFGDEDTDEVPIEYAAQAMHGLMVRGLKRVLTLFAVMVGVQLLIYWIRRDDGIIADLRAKLVKFWKENVLAGVPPAPITLPDVMLLFRRRSTPIQVEADNEVAKHVERLITARNEEAAAKFKAEDAKYEIGRYMLGAEAIGLDHENKIRPTPAAKPDRHVLTWHGLPLLTVSLQSQERIDADRIRKEFPEAAAQCAKTTSSFVFRRAKEKK